MEANIKLVGPEIKAQPGEVVTLRVLFAESCWSCIHERRESIGYSRLNDQQGGSEHIYNATIHDDTTHFIFSIGNDGRPDLGYTNDIGLLWCPVILVKNEPKEETEPQDLGNYLYSVGLISDLHISKDSNEWWDEADFRRCMDLFVKDQNIKCVMSCGDISEAATNAYKKHPEAVCDVDYNELKEMYDVPYWQVAGLRLFSPLGNHDFYGLFESREDDAITGKKNSECTSGYNANVNTRIGQLWPTGQQINGIVPGRGRIVFDLEKGKSTPTGLADMNFFSFNDYVDLYARKGGYTGNSIWDASKGGISDEAIKYAKNYVNSHWNDVKDNLVMWNDGGSHGRNGYSKLNYWLKKDNDIFIFLSVDYGNDIWPINNKWHDRMIHARTIIDTNSNDPYIKRMVEYVQDTNYSNEDKLYDYQYYSPNTLIWLKEIIENNPDKKIYVFSHHFLPNKAGNSLGIPQQGAWQYADIHKSSEKDPKESNIYSVGSNTLTGIEFWFLNKLNNNYKNVIFFSGHSHISWENEGHFVNHDYNIVSPSAQNAYVYTKADDNEKQECGYTVSLPSLSKPRYINSAGLSERRYADAECSIMEIYEKGVKIKGYKIKKDNEDVNTLLKEKSIKLIQ